MKFFLKKFFYVGEEGAYHGRKWLRINFHQTAQALERPGEERRVRHDLRENFAEACRITAAFFDVKQNWAGQSLTIYARQTLRDTYPELSQQEIALLFSAVQRFHRASQGK